MIFAMRIKIIILLTLISLSVQAQDPNAKGWFGVLKHKQVPLDKQDHFIGGLTIGTAAYFFTYGINGNRRGNAMIWGNLTTLIIGTIKELTDSRFDHNDIIANQLGAITATLTFDFLTGRAKRRNKMILARKSIYNQHKKSKLAYETN